MNGRFVAQCWGCGLTHRQEPTVCFRAFGRIFCNDCAAKSVPREQDSLRRPIGTIEVACHGKLFDVPAPGTKLYFLDEATLRVGYVARAQVMIDQGYQGEWAQLSLDVQVMDGDGEVKTQVVSPNDVVDAGAALARLDGAQP